MEPGLLETIGRYVRPIPAFFTPGASLVCNRQAREWYVRHPHIPSSTVILLVAGFTAAHSISPKENARGQILSNGFTRTNRRRLSSSTADPDLGLSQCRSPEILTDNKPAGRIRPSAPTQHRIFGASKGK